MGMIASAVTALLSLVLAWQLGMRYRQKGSVHSLLYALGLALSAVAAGADFIVKALGHWHPLAFRLYWFSAAALVGLLGLGSATLLTAPAAGGRGEGPVKWVATATEVVLAGLILWLAAAAATFPVDPALLGRVEEIATQAPAGVKLPFVLTSSLGATVIFAGSLWSWWRSRQNALLLIALGTACYAAGGTAGSFGGVLAFYAAQALGSVILYLGVTGTLGGRRNGNHG